MNILTKASWIFFATGVKPTFTQWALVERLAEVESVVIVDRPVSVLRDRKVPPLNAHCNPLPGVEGCWEYRPLHYPERLARLGKITRLINRHRLQREPDQLLPNNARRIVCYDSPTQDHLVGRLSEEISVYLATDDKTFIRYNFISVRG